MLSVQHGLVGLGTAVELEALIKRFVTAFEQIKLRVVEIRIRVLVQLSVQIAKKLESLNLNKIY